MLNNSLTLVVVVVKGSNIGMHVRFLLEPHLYPKQEYSSKVFDHYFPRMSLKSGGVRSDVCAVGFEPNPLHKRRLQLLGSYYRSRGKLMIMLSCCSLNRILS